MSYINEVREDTVFDSTNTEFIEKLFLHCLTYKQDPYLLSIAFLRNLIRTTHSQVALGVLLMTFLNTTASQTQELWLQEILVHVKNCLFHMKACTGVANLVVIAANLVFM